MNVSLFDLLVIIGMSQGLVMGFLLFISKHNQPGKRFLAFILFTFIILSSKILLHTLGLWDTHRFRYFPLAIDLVIQPFIYLYIRSTVNPGMPFKTRDAFHFIPFLLFFIHALIVYSKVMTTENLVEKDILARTLYFNQVKKWEDYLSVISAWAYCSLGYAQLKRYRIWLQDNVGDMTFPSYTWLRNILIIFGLLIFNLTLNFLADAGGFGRDNFFHWQFFYLVMAGAVYYMGIEGYRQTALPVAFSKTKTSYDVKSLPQKENITTIKEKILASLVVQKVYTDPNISLTKLAENLNLTPGVVSYTINTAFKKNFRNLINDYRLEEVKKRLIDPRASHLSILGIALECGFNSEASFYRIFKRDTGKSPKEFMETHSL